MIGFRFYKIVLPLFVEQMTLHLFQPGFRVLFATLEGAAQFFAAAKRAGMGVQALGPNARSPSKKRPRFLDCAFALLGAGQTQVSTEDALFYVIHHFSYLDVRPVVDHVSFLSSIVLFLRPLQKLEIDSRGLLLIDGKLNPYLAELLERELGCKQFERCSFHHTSYH